MSALHPDLPAALPRIAASFAQAQPFRHVVIDNFLDPALIERLLADFPTFEERYARNESGQVGGKAVRMDLPTISDSYAELDRAIQSPEFLQTISTITGIPDLLYDPAYIATFQVGVHRAGCLLLDERPLDDVIAHFADAR